jgi:hypothetical protein
MSSFNCKNCKQSVEIVITRGGLFGKSKITERKMLVNVVTGRGGRKGEKHNCPEKFNKPWPCEGCGQEIYLSKETHEKTGRNKVKNFRTDLNKGGEKDQDHICPKRLFSRFHKVLKPIYNPMRWCAHCGTEWFENVFTNCPGCSCLECRRCGFQMLPKIPTSFKGCKQYLIPRILNHFNKEDGTMTEEPYNDLAFDWPCPKCGSRDTKDWARWDKK